MNRKTHFDLFAVLGIIVLAACTPAAPTAIQAPVADTATVPTAASNNSTNTPVASATTPSAAATAVGMHSSLACGGGKISASITVELTEGPYYTPNTPERANLIEAGMPGTKLVITGYVFDTQCQPVPNAWLDFWQADANGAYDNAGYTLRGHQYTDANGRYELTTVVPGIYPGRTEHIHVKVQAPGGRVITSQLYFPGVALNAGDRIFDESLLLVIQEASDGLAGQFNFVVPGP